MQNREKFIKKVLEGLNKNQKTNFRSIEKENIPEQTFIIEDNIKGNNFIHCFEADTRNLDYKFIKTYIKALIVIVKDDFKMAKAKKPVKKPCKPKGC